MVADRAVQVALAGPAVRVAEVAVAAVVAVRGLELGLALALAGRVVAVARVEGLVAVAG